MNTRLVDLGPIVGSHGARIAAEPGGPLQHPHDTGAANAVVNGDVDALVGEVIGDGQAFQARPLASASLTESILQTALGATDRGWRSPGGRRIFLPCRMARFASRWGEWAADGIGHHGCG